MAKGDPFHQWLRTRGLNPRDLGPKGRRSQRQGYQATLTSPSPLATSPTPPTTGPADGGTVDADVTQAWRNANPLAYFQGLLKPKGLASTTGTMNFDNWLTNVYTPRLLNSYNTTLGQDAGANVTDLVDPEQARRLYLHRTDNERQPNMFAAGPGRYSWYG